MTKKLSESAFIKNSPNSTPQMLPTQNEPISIQSQPQFFDSSEPISLLTTASRSIKQSNISSQNTNISPNSSTYSTYQVSQSIKVSSTRPFITQQILPTTNNTIVKNSSQNNKLKSNAIVSIKKATASKQATNFLKRYTHATHQISQNLTTSFTSQYTIQKQLPENPIAIAHSSSQLNEDKLSNLTITSITNKKLTKTNQNTEQTTRITKQRTTQKQQYKTNTYTMYKYSNKLQQNQQFETQVRTNTASAIINGPIKSIKKLQTFQFYQYKAPAQVTRHRTHHSIAPQLPQRHI
jgi:hypothetical protein